MRPVGKGFNRRKTWNTYGLFLQLSNYCPRTGVPRPNCTFNGFLGFQIDKETKTKLKNPNGGAVRL